MYVEEMRDFFPAEPVEIDWPEWRSEHQPDLHGKSTFEKLKWVMMGMANEEVPCSQEYDDWHLIPHGDQGRYHYRSKDCPCNPEADYESLSATGVAIYRHNPCNGSIVVWDEESVNL